MVMDKICDVDPSFVAMREGLEEEISFLWDKRHSPLYSFTYITNPLFVDRIREDCNGNVWSVAKHLYVDVVSVLKIMLKSMNPTWNDVDVAKKTQLIIRDIDSLYRTGLDLVQQEAARNLLASEFYQSAHSRNLLHLGPLASRAHSARVASTTLGNKYLGLDE